MSATAATGSFAWGWPWNIAEILTGDRIEMRRPNLHGFEPTLAAGAGGSVSFCAAFQESSA
jgi:hypothetical protein